jgi:hypothetical protein
MCLTVIRIPSDLHFWGQVMLWLLITEVCGSSINIYLPVLGFLFWTEEELVRHWVSIWVIETPGFCILLYWHKPKINRITYTTKTLSFQFVLPPCWELCFSYLRSVYINQGQLLDLFANPSQPLLYSTDKATMPDKLVLPGQHYLCLDQSYVSWVLWVSLLMVALLFTCSLNSSYHNVRKDCLTLSTKSLGSLKRSLTW